MRMLSCLRQCICKLFTTHFYHTTFVDLLECTWARSLACVVVQRPEQVRLWQSGGYKETLGPLVSRAIFSVFMIATPVYCAFPFLALKRNKK